MSNLYYRKGSELKVTERGPLIDLETLPIPRKDIIPDIKIYETGKGGIGVNTKRGCPCRCSYCNYYLLNGLKVRMRPPVQVVDEIEELVNKYGMKEFMFADGMFSSPFRHAKEICEEMKGREIKVQWDAWCDIRDINEEFIDIVSAAGCRSLIISPDAYSNSALEGLNKKITTRQVRRAIKLLMHRSNLRIGFCFFQASPGETFWGYLQTLFYYINSIISITLRGRGGCGFSWIRIEPDTQIRKTAVRDGTITEETELLPEDIESLQKLFYVKPSLRFIDPLSRMIVSSVSLIKGIIGRKRHKR